MDERSEVVRRALEYPYAIPRSSYALAHGRVLDLDEVEVAVDTDERVPLLAYGSNAAPEVLSQKLAAAPDPIPVVRAALRDVDVVYSAHVSRYGAVPATLRRSPGTEVPAFVAYLSPEQLALLSPTEPNYLLTTLVAPRCEVDHGTVPRALRAYLSRHGCLRLDGTAIALDAIPAGGRTLPSLPQRQVLERVRDILHPGSELEDFIALAASPGR
jgi:hypothetical protein